MWICSAKWKKFGRKAVFYDELKGEWNVHGADDLVMCFGDFNGHMGRHIVEIDGDSRGCGVGKTNFERRMLLEFCLDKELCVSNTWE